MFPEIGENVSFRLPKHESDTEDAKNTRQSWSDAQEKQRTSRKTEQGGRKRKRCHVRSPEQARQLDARPLIFGCKKSKISDEKTRPKAEERYPPVARFRHVGLRRLTGEAAEVRRPLFEKRCHPLGGLFVVPNGVQEFAAVHPGRVVHISQEIQIGFHVAQGGWGMA